MKRSAITATVATILGFLAVLALTPVVQALFIDPFAPTREKVDCGALDNIICRECCEGGFGCPGAEEPRVFCCRDPDNCDVIDPPDDADPVSATIRLDLMAGGARLKFTRRERVDRKSGERRFEVTLQQSFLALGRRSRFIARAEIAGADAAVGSLLYAVAFLDRGPATVDALRAFGYDVSLFGEPPELACPSGFQELCSFLAGQLSEGISASLAIGTSGERAPFLQGLQAIGHGQCGRGVP